MTKLFLFEEGVLVGEESLPSEDVPAARKYYAEHGYAVEEELIS